MPGIQTQKGVGVVQQATIFSQLFRQHKARVIADAGTVNSDSFTNAYINHLRNNQRFDNVKAMISPEFGDKLRVVGNDKYVSKLYSVTLTDKDATQATTTTQPILSYADNPSKQSITSPVLTGKVINHPAIKFESNEAWSYTLVCQNFGIPSTYTAAYVFNNATANYFNKLNLNVQARFVLGNNHTYQFNKLQLYQQTGRNNVFNFVADGLGNLSVYLNGRFIETVASTSTATEFKSILFSEATFQFQGKVHLHLIESGALTADKILYQYNFIRQYIPDIDSITINSQQYSSSNYEAIIDHSGTKIAQASSDLDWATGAARWDYYNHDVVNYLYGKVYNKAAKDLIKLNPPVGWKVSTEAELTDLVSIVGANLKSAIGWTTAGTNSTGFTALGGASRNADGTFNTINETVSFWCANSDNVLKISNDGTVEIVAAQANEGHYIRLTKDPDSFEQTFQSISIVTHNGYTTDGINHYTFGTGEIKKFNANWELIASNPDTLTGSGSNHSGDGHYYNGKLYVAFEDGKAQIAIFNASDLSLDSYHEIAVPVNGASGLVVVPEDGYIYVCDFRRNAIYVINMADYSLVSTITPSETINEVQGIAHKDGYLYLNADCWIVNTFHLTYKLSKDGTVLRRYKLRDLGGNELPRAHEGIDYNQSTLRMLSNNYIYYFSID